VIGLPALRGRLAAPISSPGVDHDEVRFDREPVAACAACARGLGEPGPARPDGAHEYSVEQTCAACGIG